jgi:hypothetical protein
MKKVSAVIGLAAVVFSIAASSASAGLVLSASDDSGKYSRDKGRSFVSLLTDAGFSENRLTVRWNPSQPRTITDKPFIDKYLPKATRSGIRVVFAVYPEFATGITGTPNGQQAFADFLRIVARTYPQVTKIVVGNEPNQPRFWQPQFNGDGTPASGPAYEALLALAYDTLKSVNPNIDVIGLPLNGHGNDDPAAASNVSTSPIKFIRDVGAAYKASGRTAPIMDEMGFHPYPADSTDPISKGFQWPNAGFANLDRIKQAVYDAFHGTGQPVFGEGADGGGLKLRIDEISWQTAIPSSSAYAYQGQENVAVTDEQTQAQIYADLVKEAECDPSLSALSFFGIIDEADLATFQGGLVRADGTLRPSYDAVRQTMAQTAGNCSLAPVTWTHTTGVVGALPKWGKLAPRKAYETYWSFNATAGEDATYRAGIFKVKGPGAPKGRTTQIAQKLAATKGAPAALNMTGAVKAYWSPLVKFPAKKLAAGWYVYGIRLASVVSPDRTSVFTSKPFRVGPKKTTKK